MRIASRETPSINWAYAYERWGPELARYLRRFARDDTDAQDMLQETFMNAMRADRQPEVDQHAPWLYRIATNVALSALRSRRRRLFSPLARATDLESPSYEFDRIEQVRRALQSIPADQAVALVLVLHHGFARTEAARILGIPEETLKSRVARGRLNFVAAYRRLERGLVR